ncbi:294_t:CDS:2 [Diversispora eburnea]|uniref:294_t:CDS:1 n=1 Tax=Diversispora eburnea TaxID=1213867 RepID=A0A9N9B7P7_9GLOM|nr:294_t:CDS:2 [Diversispora eburnea]
MAKFHDVAINDNTAQTNKYNILKMVMSTEFVATNSKRSKVKEIIFTTILFRRCSWPNQRAITLWSHSITRFLPV